MTIKSVASTSIASVDLGGEGSVLLNNGMAHDWVVSGCKVRNGKSEMFTFSDPRNQLRQWQELIPGVYIKCGVQRRSIHSVQVKYPANASFSVAEYQ